MELKDISTQDLLNEAFGRSKALAQFADLVGIHSDSTETALNAELSTFKPKLKQLVAADIVGETAQKTAKHLQALASALGADIDAKDVAASIDTLSQKAKELSERTANLPSADDIAARVEKARKEAQETAAAEAKKDYENQIKELNEKVGTFERTALQQRQNELFGESVKDLAAYLKGTSLIQKALAADGYSLEKDGDKVFVRDANGNYIKSGNARVTAADFIKKQAIDSGVYVEQNAPRSGAPLPISGAQTSFKNDAERDMHMLLSGEI